MKGLTKKQGEILEYIKREVRLKGYPPSVREICYAVNLSSTSSVHAHLNSLERLGYIRRDPSKPRAIEVLPTEIDRQNKEMAEIPIVGKVTAGAPILAIENIEDVFPIPVEYIGNKDVFMLRVSGESMINVGIYDKDLILVQKQSAAKNGDIVVALIEDSATVKTFYKDRGRIRLQPENNAMLPIYVDSVEILGIVIGLFRMF